MVPRISTRRLDGRNGHRHAGDLAKTTLVTKTSPIKPRPPPRCFRNVPRKERPLREILEVRLHPRREFGKKRSGAISFGSKFPSKSRVGNQTHFEVPGPGSYRLPEATGGKHAPQVSIGLSDRPNYFKDLQRRAAESPRQSFSSSHWSWALVLFVIEMFSRPPKNRILALALALT